MLELLAPAGSMQALTAAVYGGANAVYLGFGDFNARRNAKNFTREEVEQGVALCHLHGVKVYLTMNTLLTDRELPAAAEFAAQASAMGIDAVLVQDLGVLRMLRQTVPDLPVHASTQMSVHTLDGAKLAADLGMTRVVLARELDRSQIEHICAHSPIEVEVFVHGALCMCYSGQCFFSSVIGGRSGNRGLCAQPCRMMYGWNGKADSYPLSLKDMSLAGHLKQLDEIGVTCVKLEGRMKRPEYVSIVTGVYSRAIREGREPTARELEMLRQAFSRDGFTDGYFMDNKGPHMFGIRREEEEPKELFAQARAAYEGKQPGTVPVYMSADIRADRPARVQAWDEDGNRVQADGPVPEPARSVPLTQEKVSAQLERTGGTAFVCRGVQVQVDEGLSLPLSALNALRRELLDKLSQCRTALPQRRENKFVPAPARANRNDAPRVTVSVRNAQQITPELLACKPVMLYVPCEEGAAHPDKVEQAIAAGVPVGAILPRIFWDRERESVVRELETLRALGVSDALVATPGAIQLAKELGFALRADFGLGVFNSLTLEQLGELGFVSATASFELRLAQIRDLCKNMDVELMAYGRLPLMITENCIVHNHTGKHTCHQTSLLTDRKGERFPVVKAYGCRNEILNARTLYLADKRADWDALGLWAARLYFTTESPEQCAQILREYIHPSAVAPEGITRGLYYRAVE